MKWSLIVAAVIVMVLVAWSYRSYTQDRTRWRLVRSIGAAFLLVTIFTHICEELNLFPFMGWGSPHTPGHYLDLTSAVLGVTLFLLGSAATWFKSSSQI